MSCSTHESSKLRQGGLYPSGRGTWLQQLPPRPCRRRCLCHSFSQHCPNDSSKKRELTPVSQHSVLVECINHGHHVTCGISGTDVFANLFLSLKASFRKELGLHPNFSQRGIRRVGKGSILPRGFIRLCLVIARHSKRVCCAPRVNTNDIVFTSGIAAYCISIDSRTH